MVSLPFERSVRTELPNGPPGADSLPGRTIRPELLLCQADLCRRLTAPVGLLRMPRVARRQFDTGREVSRMTWETPTFEEVKMDAEINSYQDDFDRDDFNGVDR